MNQKPFAYHIISTKDWILEQYYTDIKFIARNCKAQREINKLSERNKSNKEAQPNKYHKLFSKINVKRKKLI